jgi:RimJ/RimL family protein N-acetyltransferase
MTPRMTPDLTAGMTPDLPPGRNILTTERLILRPYRRGDFSAMTALWADPAVMRYITGTPCTPDVTWARLLRNAGHWQMLGWGTWAIELRATGEFIGETGFGDYQRDITPAPGERPEAGWLLRPQHQGQGLATEAVLAAHEWADARFDQATVCLIDPANDASLRLARRAGYGATVETEFRGDPCLILERPCQQRPGDHPGDRPHSDPL